MSQAMMVDSAEDTMRNPVRCEKCLSPYAIDPAKRKKTSGENLQKPRFRKRVDVETNKVLILCNKCGLKMGRGKKRPPRKLLPTDDEKKSYLEEAKSFAVSLAERMQQPDAKHLYCPNMKSNLCGCLQKYIKGGEDNHPEMYERALYLTSLLRNARELSTEKMHTASSSELIEDESEKNDTILCRGIGNRHSKMFEEFVLANRKYLRDQLKLCERACQKVLLYSNNFLHKELKSRKNQRVENKSQKYAKMKPITELVSMSCCKDQCVRQAVTQPDTLMGWRLSAQGGQQEARRVIAEMLTPSVGFKSNCYRFISFVTGCSLTKICSVKRHLINTSGSGDPPEHGLKRWWRENPKKGRRMEEPAAKKSTSVENKCLSEEALEVEAAVLNSDVMPTRSGLCPPPYDSVVSSKGSVMQMESPKELQFELPGKVDVLKLPVQEFQGVIESPAEKDSQNALASTSSLLQSTVQQLLLSPDIVSVTIMAAPKSPSRHAQITTMENTAKEGIVLTQTIESGQGVSAANARQVIQICQQAPSVKSNIQQNLKEDEVVSNTGMNYIMQQSVSERITSVHSSPAKPGAVQRRQLLHVFEIPHRDSTSGASASGSALSEEVGGSCLRSLIILPETIVIDPSVAESKYTSSEASHR